MIADNEIKALITLLDDEDKEVLHHVENRILSLGESVLPFLENEWENNLNPNLQSKLEHLIHTLQFQTTKQRLQDWKENQQHDLLRGMWIVASYQYPEVQLEELQEKIDQLYYNVWVHFKDGLNPYDQVKILNYVLYEEFRLSSNTKNFHSPANNMLNVVLESKKGNPISLCVVYMLVAQKLKLPIYGVNLPNLFILVYDWDFRPFYINAFNKGLVFTKSDIDNYIQQLGLEQQESFYRPCKHIDIIRRICRNLVVAYEHLGEAHKMKEIGELLAILED
jgi:regulator of sirC expression with transglutaminase-like and TPR domain